MRRTRARPPTTAAVARARARAARPGRAAGRPHLGCDPEAVAHAELCRKVADGGLRRAVHRRGIDHAAAELDEAPEHLALRPAPRGLADVERLPGAEPERRDGLAARGNRAGEAHGVLSRMSSYAGNEYMGIAFIVCSAMRGPIPMRPRRSMIGANITRSIVSCWIVFNIASRLAGSRSRDWCRNISSRSGYPP